MNRVAVHTHQGNNEGFTEHADSVTNLTPFCCNSNFLITVKVEHLWNALFTATITVLVHSGGS
jgi:hypothetical protein